MQALASALVSSFLQPELQNVLLYVAECHYCTNETSLRQCFCAEAQELSCCTAEAFISLTRALLHI